MLGTQCYFCLACKVLVVGDSPDTHIESQRHKEHEKMVEKVIKELSTMHYVVDVEGRPSQNQYKCTYCDTSTSDYQAAVHHLQFHNNDPKDSSYQHTLIHTVNVKQEICVTETDISNVRPEQNVVLTKIIKRSNDETISDEMSSVTSSSDDGEFKEVKGPNTKSEERSRFSWTNSCDNPMRDNLPGHCHTEQIADDSNLTTQGTSEGTVETDSQFVELLAEGRGDYDMVTRFYR